MEGLNNKISLVVMDYCSIWNQIYTTMRLMKRSFHIINILGLNIEINQTGETVR
jgi:hypothetical protein